MGKKIIYSCDKCDKQVLANPEANEFKECDAVNLEMNIRISGFADEDCDVGIFTQKKDFLLCIECLQSSLGSNDFDEIKSKIWGKENAAN